MSRIHGVPVTDPDIPADSSARMNALQLNNPNSTPAQIAAASFLPVQSTNAPVVVESEHPIEDSVTNPVPFSVAESIIETVLSSNSAPTVVSVSSFVTGPVQPVVASESSSETGSVQPVVSAESSSVTGPVQPVYSADSLNGTNSNDTPFSLLNASIEAQQSEMPDYGWGEED